MKKELEAKFHAFLGSKFHSFRNNRTFNDGVYKEKCILRTNKELSPIMMDNFIAMVHKFVEEYHTLNARWTLDDTTTYKDDVFQIMFTICWDNIISESEVE